MIGYYAHSHGSGHSRYANLFSRLAPGAVTIFTDSRFPFDSPADVVHLDNENPDGTQLNRTTYSEPDCLHYAPVGMSKITERNKRILEGILERGIQLMIVDVSVEMASLMRVSSVPYAYVRLMGKRDDTAHTCAYQGALFLLAFYPKELEPEETPDWVVQKTVYLNFLTERPKFRTRQSLDLPQNYVLYMQGLGGHDDAPELIEKIAEYLSPRPLLTIGPLMRSPQVSNLIQLGLVSDAQGFIAGAEIVIASCGMNTVTEIFCHRKKYLMHPQKRPYHEQYFMAKSLEKLGLAVRLDSEDLQGNFSKLEKQETAFDPNWVGSENLQYFLDFLEVFNYRPRDFMGPLWSDSFQAFLEAYNQHPMFDSN